MCNRRFSVAVHGERPSRWPNASSRPSAARFVGSKHVFKRFYSLIMISLSLRQLDRTRQPGFARVDARWYAAMGGASQASVMNITVKELKAIGGRDPRSQRSIGAGTEKGFTP